MKKSVPPSRTAGEGEASCASERGSVLVESAVAFAALFITTIVTVDLGRYIDLRLRVARLSYEAARYAAAAPGLEQGVEGPIHDRVRLRIEELIVNHGLRSEEVDLSTGHYTGAAFGSAANTVAVQISAKYSPLFGIPGFSLPTTVASKIEAPYLYR